MEGESDVHQDEFHEILADVDLDVSEAEPYSAVAQANHDKSASLTPVADQMRKVQAHLPLVKCRGRPRDSRTIGRFNQTQRKRKASGREGSRKKTKKALSQLCTSDPTPEVPQTSNADEEIIDDSICFICLHEDPPREVSRNPQTECDEDCGRWFHTACIKHSGVPVVGYKCIQCLS